MKRIFFNIHGVDWMALGTEAGKIDRAELLKKDGTVPPGGDREEALMAFGADCHNYGFSLSDVDPDDKEEYISAYIAALNGEA